MEGSEFKVKISKEKITEILNKRHKERQLNIENLHELKYKEASEVEGVDYFDQMFDDKTLEIQNNLNNLQPSDKNQLLMTFNEISISIQGLQKYLSTSTLFLTDYKIKTCQNTINELQNKFDELKNIYVPKKKFGFRTKSTTPSVVSEMILPKNDSKLADNDDDIDNSGKINDDKKKISKQQFEWTISNRSNEFIILSDSEVNGKDLTFCNLKNCLIKIFGHPGSLQLSKINNCTILSGPISRSVFANDCNSCHFVFACQQLRLHTSNECDIYLHVTCRAIIEDCTEIYVAPYNWNYDKLNIDFIKSGLDQTINNWQNIGDFNWLSPDKQSPNWHKMNETRIITNWDSFIDKIKKEYALVESV